MTTAPACQVSGYRTNSVVTSNWTTVQSGAPNLNMPISTGWIGTDTGTWKAAEVHYETTGSTQAWSYNGHPSYEGTFYATEDDGISSLEWAWADFKRGVQGHYGWESVYWTDSNNGCGDTDIWNSAATFKGCSASYNTVAGMHTSNYSNGDGVLMYPGTDVIGTVNYGFDGPMPSLRLERMLDGLNDQEYLTKAQAINPTTTNTKVVTMIPQSLWEHNCFTLSDCSYAYGGRTWSNDPNVWETARQQIAGIVVGAAPSSSAKSIQGNFTIPGFNGTLK